jgi:hypothetical protein
MRISRWTCGLVFVAASACGGSKSSPAAPTSTPPPQAAPTVTSLAIDGPGALLTNTSADYTATANFSNQTTQTVTATWRSESATSHASVSAAGRVTGQTHGSFTLAAAFQGVTASKSVNVVSNYDGRWMGVVVRMTCQLNGALGRRITQRLCPAGPNERMPMSFTISQPSPSFTQLTAVLNIANTILNVSGTVAADGRLVLGGDTEYQVPDPVSKRPETLRWTILKWDTRLAVPASLMSGRFDRNRTESLWQGNVYEEFQIEQMRRAPGLTETVNDEGIVVRRAGM